MWALSVGLVGVCPIYSRSSGPRSCYCGATFAQTVIEQQEEIRKRTVVVLSATGRGDDQAPENQFDDEAETG
jgi:hypothetical protein